MLKRMAKFEEDTATEACWQLRVSFRLVGFTSEASRTMRPVCVLYAKPVEHTQSYKYSGPGSAQVECGPHVGTRGPSREGVVTEHSSANAHEPSRLEVELYSHPHA